MKMTYLSQPPPNMNSIREVCDTLGTESLTSFVGNHWATGWLRVNSTSCKGRDYKRSFVCLYRVESRGPAVCSNIWPICCTCVDNIAIILSSLSGGSLCCWFFWKGVLPLHIFLLLTFPKDGSRETKITRIINKTNLTYPIDVNFLLLHRYE